MGGAVPLARPRRDMGVRQSRGVRQRRHCARHQPDRRQPFASGGRKRSAALAQWRAGLDHRSNVRRARLRLCGRLRRGRAAGIGFDGLGIFRNEAENNWRPVSVPRGAAPARAIVRSGEDGRAYLAGWAGLFRSDDWGASWSRAADGLPNEPATALLVVNDSPETLYAIVQGAIWASVDGARTWARRGAGISPTNVDVLAVDPRHPTRIWAAGGDRLFRSNDGGASWQGVGRSLPEPNTTVHGIITSEEAIVVTTDRGLYLTVDGGERWALIIDNLPAHLEAGPLVRDPLDPATLYAGFALVPYSELWRRAVEREGTFARVSVASLAGGGILLVVVALGALAALRWLGRYYRPPARTSPATRTARDRGMEGKTLP
jgi:hypothetical protein